MMKEKTIRQDRTPARRGRGDELLGPNSDIGRRLRALYGSIQDEVIPDKFIDLLEKLDTVEARQRASHAEQGE
jgi:hypothetical protein